MADRAAEIWVVVARRRGRARAPEPVPRSRRMRGDAGDAGRYGEMAHLRVERVDVAVHEHVGEDQVPATWHQGKVRREWPRVTKGGMG